MLLSTLTSRGIAASLAQYAKYRPLEILGQGAFGTVVKAVDLETNQLVAIKLLNRQDRNRYVESEVVNHSLLQHPHIVQFREVYLTSEHICLVMEYADSGTLLKYLQQQRRGRFKEPLARWFFQQLVVAVDYCHLRGVVIRDLKLENALLHRVQGQQLPMIKMCDFGYSKAAFQSGPNSTVGSLAYMAPEVLISRGHQYDGVKADVWSIGVILFIMVCGTIPFPNREPSVMTPANLRDIFERMINRSYHFPEGVELELSDSCRNLLIHLLEPEPSRRPTLQQVQQHAMFLTNLSPQAASMNAEYLRRCAAPDAEAFALNLRRQLHQLLATPQPARRAWPEEQVNCEEEHLQQAMDLALRQGMARWTSRTLREYVHAHRSAQ